MCMIATTMGESEMFVFWVFVWPNWSTHSGSTQLEDKCSIVYHHLLTLIDKRVAEIFPR